MGKNAANIVIGAPSTIICAAAGVAEGSGVDLGSTVGGFKLNGSLTIIKKKVDQWNGTVGAEVADSEYTFEFTLGEVTTANLAYALGLPTTAAASAVAMKAGNLSTATLRTLYVNSKAVAGGLSKYTLHLVVFDGKTTIDMNKEKQTGLKLTGFLLLDTTQPDGEEYFSVDYSATDITPPTVALTTPAEDGTVTRDAKGTVICTFTETNKLDEGSLVYGDAANGSVRVLDITDQTAVALVAGAIVYNSATKQLIFTPTANWTTVHKHVIIIDTKVRDNAGNHLAVTFFGNFTVSA